MPADLAKHAADLERLLKLRSIPFGMKLFALRADMEAIPRIRRPASDIGLKLGAVVMVSVMAGRRS